MLKGLIGEKIGMTQIFDQNKKVVPVSVIYFSDWVVTQLKSVKKDGYSAVQVGKLKKKYLENKFSENWLSNKKEYFSKVREVSIDQESENKVVIGQKLDLSNVSLSEGEIINVAGTSIGKGFQGVVKRWGFAGGPASHGSMFHRAPGAIGHMRTQGEVIKGKKLPGQLGSRRFTVRKLKIVRIDKNIGCLYIKGSVPGKKNTLLEISKQG
ncbi:TPA: 50S ribosomal protein L3 [Candidatus Dependentiae bacterium]|nr:MAG: 50S ribosomal protein L3 [candidate division TM6 bacterium GW2011_GWE2_31_21]KKP53127.1 MAG: 50S ribosomal protein L3 [candidate division TM6 bacterium GW2011_GWF2_33_332]HBS47946.1 50S ribosomal protein L3 [Candidatus Dependentiae bacterium]HBZ73450.1 50S ribosomal protein L3 [Candidatus Dependentiae bacterium]